MVPSPLMLNVNIFLPVFKSQVFVVLSSWIEIKYLLLNVTINCLTELLFPTKFNVSFLVSKFQTLIIPSIEADIPCFPSGVIIIASKELLWFRDTFCCFSTSGLRMLIFFSKSQILIVSSTELEMICLPFGVTATAVTLFVWPAKLASSFPVSELNIFIVLSDDPEIISLLSTDTATALISSVWLAKVRIFFLLSKFQMPIVLSNDPDMINCPSGEQTIELILLWSFNSKIS